MSQDPSDIDPYAELEFRADAGELSEGYRLPVAVRRRRRVQRIVAVPGRRGV
jgi:hypothetical protein